MSESESVSERELAQYFADEVFSGKPRSVGEALADEAPPEPEALPEADTPSPEGEPPVVIQDEPPDRSLPPEEPEVPSEEPGVEPEEGEEPEEEGDVHVAWATKKYGNEPPKWAKAAYDLEQIVTRLGNQNREKDQLLLQANQYIESREQEFAQQQQMGMPMSAQEEAWVEQAVMNPLEYARAAAFNGNFALYNGVIQRIAEENPMLASQIGTQVQMDLQAAAQAEQQQMNGQPPSLDQLLGTTFQRLGLDINEVGPGMAEKVGELGQHHPYVEAILYGDPRQRELAVQAIHDLVRAGTQHKRVIRDEEREAALKREGELRREAAGVVTGAPHVPPQPAQSPLLSAMEEEWKARRQWGDE